MLEIVFLVAFGVSCYVWWKEKSKANLRYIWLCAVIMSELIWQRVAKDILPFSGTASLINLYFERAFWIAMGAVFLLLLSKSSKDKRSETIKRLRS